MQLFLTFVGWIIMGSATAYFAQRRGRDPIIWFVVGLLLGVFGLILVFVLPDFSNKQEAKIEEDNLVHPKQLEPIHESQWWYLNKEGEQLGPIYTSEIKKLFDEDVLSEESFVWCEGMQDWKKIEDLPEFSSM